MRESVLDMPEAIGRDIEDSRCLLGGDHDGVFLEVVADALLYEDGNLSGQVVEELCVGDLLVGEIDGVHRA